jgi:allophanate hydrolase subunit 2
MNKQISFESFDDIGGWQGRPMTEEDREAIKRYIADYKAKKETEAKQKPKKTTSPKKTRTK